MLMVVGLTGGAAAFSIAAGSSAASTAGLRCGSRCTARIVLRYAPTINLTNADLGRSYAVTLGSTVVVVLTPPPQWSPYRALGYNARAVSGQQPMPLELRYDCILAQGDLVLAYVAVEPGRENVGATYPCTIAPPDQCTSKVWFASITVSSGTTTTSSTIPSSWITTIPSSMTPTTTATTTPTPSTTEGIIVNPPTTRVTYPTPYAPSYDTVATLVDDSTFIVIATVGMENTDIDGYPLQVQQALRFNNPRTSLAITPTEFNAAGLSVGSSYVFFYASDPVDNSTCIVGGVKGTFAYDANSQTVTRLDQSTTSQIPRTQSLSDLQDSIATAENVEASKPTSNPPPMCSSSATGL